MTNKMEEEQEYTKLEKGVTQQHQITKKTQYFLHQTTCSSSFSPKSLHQSIDKGLSSDQGLFLLLPGQTNPPNKSPVESQSFCQCFPFHTQHSLCCGMASLSKDPTACQHFPG